MTKNSVILVIDCTTLCFHRLLRYPRVVHLRRQHFPWTAFSSFFDSWSADAEDPLVCPLHCLSLRMVADVEDPQKRPLPPPLPLPLDSNYIKPGMQWPEKNLNLYCLKETPKTLQWSPIKGRDFHQNESCPSCPLSPSRYEERREQGRQLSS